MPARRTNALQRLLTPPVFENQAKTDTAWVLHWLIWSVAGLITLLIVLLIPVTGESPGRFLGQALFVDMLCLGMIALVSRGRVELGARFLVVGMWMIAIFTVMTSGGLMSPAIATFLLAVAYASLFLGTGAGVTSAIGAAAMFFALAYMEGVGAIPEPAVLHTPWSRALTLTTYAIILASALVLMARTLDRARGRTDHELAERRSAEAEVRTLNAQLEARVAERTEALEKAVAELELTNEQLAAATRTKNDFLAAMSHELRTPLNSVIGFSGILSSGMTGELNEEQKRQVEMIRDSGRLLLELVNKVLDLAKIEAGDDEVTLGEFDLNGAVRRVVELAKPLATEKGLALTSDFDEQVGQIRSDRLRIEQALLNLVGNAVKFTDHGSVAVETRRENGDAVLEVRDTGVGIPQDEISLIFDQFYQVRPDSGAKHNGAGLGLTLSQQLIESVGGSVEAQSVWGEGSAFRIRLPLDSVED